MNSTALTKPSLVTKFAAKFGVEPEKMLATLKATAFKQKGETAITNEQMMALMIVSDQYSLNPFTKEIYAFPDRNGIVPVVSVDGWSRIVNEHPNYDGIEFIDGPTSPAGVPEWIECVIYRKDRQHPTKVRERFNEVRRDTQPWTSHPSRMLRHKTFIQCARLAFGFAGIYDEDEAERIREIDVTPVVVEQPKPQTKTSAVVDRLRPKQEEHEPPKPTPQPEEVPTQERTPVQEPGDAGPEKPISYAQAEYVIGNTTDRGIADECLDVARGCLTKAEYAKLVALWNSRFSETVGGDS
jgi:phage recombination protein Bet